MCLHTLRRRILGALVVLALPASPGKTRAADPPRRPNFVFVYTDDQRWDTMSVVQREQGSKGRFPWLKTPHFDRLAAEGVRFRNAFVVNSLCSPSRASFLTGRYGHFNGIVNNHTPFDATQTTYAGLLRHAGYRTGYIGKFHMGPQRGPRPGFDYSASFVGQGRYQDCPFEVNGQETATRGWVDDVSTDFALEFLRASKDKPFLLVVGFKAAHGPFSPPERFATTYAGEQAREVPNLDRSPPYVANAAQTPFAAKPSGRGPTNLGYFRCLTAADDNLGRILRELDALKLADDTVVVFTSDNGFYLGEHRLGDKRSAYDESLRIPLLLRYPRLGLSGRAIDQMVLNIDIASTFLDLAGVTPPATLQGRSWLPLLRQEKPDWRNAYFYAYFYESGFRIPTVTAVRTETAKLIKYPGHDDWTEVFDLRADPYEIKNLAADPARAGLRRELEAAYERQKQAVGFVVPPFADDPGGERPRAPRNAWVLDYRFDQDNESRVVDGSTLANHGRATGVALVDGRDGRKARRFDGRGLIEVARSASLDPALASWTIEVVTRPEAATGTVLACGGRLNGYSLRLVDGRPAFTIVTRGKTTTIAGAAPVLDQWVTLTARIGPGQAARLQVDGREVARGILPDALATPNDPLQIGADQGSLVVEPAPPRFVGLIERVRLFSGSAP